MSTSRFYRIFIIAGIISLSVAYVGLWFRFINDPVERTGSDFIGFYSIGRIAQDDGTSRVYDPLLQQNIQEEVVGFQLAPGQVLINQHLPFLIPILQSIVSPDYILSFYRWNLLMLLVYVISIMILSQIMKVNQLETNSMILVGLGGLLFYPLFFSLLNGQDTALCFLGISIWVFGLLTGREMISGLGLSLATTRPQIAIFIAIPMFFHHRRVFWGFAIGSGILSLLSFALLGINGTREFLNVLFITAEGQSYGLNERYMYNLTGLLLRILPWLKNDVIHTISWLAYGAMIIGLCIAWKRIQDDRDRHLGMIITAAVFLAPHLHFHDLTLLLIPIYGLIWASTTIEEQKKSMMMALPIAVSLLLLVSNISFFLQYTTPYLLMLALVVYPYYQNSKKPPATRHQS